MELQEGIEPSNAVYKTAVIPLNYRSVVVPRGVEPLYTVSKTVVLSIGRKNLGGKYPILTDDTLRYMELATPLFRTLTQFSLILI